MRERLAEKGWRWGWRRGWGWRSGWGWRWFRTGSGVAEKNMDRDRIAEQGLVNRDGPHNHVLNGRGARRAVECWNNDEPSGSLCRSRGDIRVLARTGGSVRTNPIIVSRPWLQSGYSSAIDIANVQAVIALHVTAERVARGNIQ